MANRGLWANLQVRDALIRQLGNSPAACSLLADAATPAGSGTFASWFRACTEHIHDLSSEPDEQILRSFLDWCGSFSKVESLPALVAEAIQARQTQKNHLRRKKSDYVNRFDLKFDEAKRNTFVESMPRREVHRLKTPYPAQGFFAFEEQSIAQLWRKKLTQDKQADDRLKRRYLRQVSEKKLKLVVSEEQDALFYDGEDLVGGVIRNFCPDKEACAWVDGVVQDQVEFRKSIRLEDPGSLVQIGYSAGSRSSPKFDWVRNVQREGIFPPGTREERDRQGSCAFAYMWNLARNKVPQQVIDDFEKFAAKLQIGRMDSLGSLAADGKGERGNSGTLAGNSQSTGTYTLQSGGSEFTFHGAELAPPTGVMASNYARAVHFENQPNEFSISWTTSRSHGTKAGGHFYIASYGIRINAAANTAVFWRPKDSHCTSLQRVNPYDNYPDFSQCGLALVTSSRLESIWAQYRNKLISPADAEKEILKAEAVDETLDSAGLDESIDNEGSSSSDTDSGSDKEV